MQRLRHRKSFGGSWRAAWVLPPLLLALFLPRFAPAQTVEEGPELLLPETISESDVEMRGRYARQWKDESGVLVLLFTGDFRLDMGQRRLSAKDAVVWIQPAKLEAENRKYYDLTVYLSGDAEVRETGGTLTQDRTLLVSNLRTFGKIIKYHDAHAPEPQEDSALYRQALLDRYQIEQAAGEAASQPATQPTVQPGGPAVVRPTDVKRARRAAARLIRYDLPPIEPIKTPSGELVYVAMGRVYLSQSGGPDAPALEIQADRAVVFPVEGAAASFLGRFEGEENAGKTGEPREKKSRGAPQSRPAGEETEHRTGEAGPASRPTETQPAKAGPLGAGGLERAIRAVYLEGDVVLSLGDRFVRAERLYYDFEQDRALLLDAVFRADVPQRSIPLYIRADEIRQLSAREFAAKKARLSTSEFYTPHYHVGAEKAYLRDTTPRDATGKAAAPATSTYEMRDATFNVLGFPLLYWPYSRGDAQESEFALRRFTAGYSSEFGATVKTAWRLFNLLGMQKPPGYDATLLLDYFSKRGPGIGINADYERENYYGLIRSYYIHDTGEDDFGPYRDDIPDTENRGRFLARHRQFLPNGWEATFELSYVSDSGFLETYDKSEWFEGKEQETLIYLKRARDVEAITLLANWRLLDFITQTEHLPDLTYRRIGDTFASPLVLYNESRVGMVRYRIDDRTYYQTSTVSNTGETRSTFRPDIRQEAELPLKLGPLNVVPFLTLRGSFWDGVPLHPDALWRGFLNGGVRGSTQFSRVYDGIESDLFDIHRIRHIIKPDFAVWGGSTTVHTDELPPFDYGIETIDDFYGARVGLKQIWQTKRGGTEDRGVEGMGRPGRTVDLLTFNLEVGAFGGAGVHAVQRSGATYNKEGEPTNAKSNGYANPLRPENSRPRNYLAGDLAWRLSETTSLLYDFNFDLNDHSFDRQDVSLAVERLPRTAYILGVRHAGDINMTLIGGGFNYKLNEKHIVSFRSWYDLVEGELGEISMAYVRKLPRWYVAFNVEYSDIDDDLSVSISVWPEGIPEWSLGGRRFTGLSTTTGIRP